MYRLTKLEERVVLDGAAVAELAAEQVTELATESAEAVAELSEHLASLGRQESDNKLQAAIDLVLISDGLDNHEQLLASVAQQGHVQALIYNADSDSATDILAGVQQLANSQGVQLQSLTLLSHGSAGQFNLGQDIINSQQLLSQAQQWQALGQVMTSDAQLFLYGCNVLADASGQQLIDQLAGLTGTQVFASDDISGAGGDWQLEGSSYNAELAATNQALAADKLADYQGQLIPPTIATNTVNLAENAQNVVITNANLQATDPDGVTPPQNLIYRITGAAADGELRNTNTGLALGVNNTFTQQDVDNGFIVYTHNGAENATDSMTLTVRDLFDVSSEATLNFSISQVNDAPLVDLNPANGGTTSFVTTFTEGDGQTAIVSAAGVSLVDPDPTSSQIDFATVMFADLFNPNLDGSFNPLLPADGTSESIAADAAALAGAGLTSNYDANTGVLTISGRASLTDYQTVLSTLSYANSEAENPTSGARFIVTNVTDEHGDNSDSVVTQVTVQPVNDPPSVTIPAAQQNQVIAEDGNFVITGTVVDDADLIGADRADSNLSLEVTLSTQNGGGNLSLAQTTGLSFTEGDGTNDARIVFSGSLNDINSALASITYAGTNNFNGNDSLQIAVNDQGNIGNGTTPVAMAQANVTVTAVNDAPVITVPGGQTGAEDTNLVINGTSVADVDVNAAAAADPNVQFTVQLALDNNSGTLTLGDTTDITFAAGSANGQPGMTFTGNLNAINNALNSITYRGNADFNGTDTIRVDVNDQGNEGAPGPLNAIQQSIGLNITQVNDPVDIDIPPGQQSVTVNEDTGIDITGVMLDDPDGNNTTVQVTLAVSNGTLTLAQTTGLTFVNGADGTNTMTLSGTITDINAAIATLTYQGTLNYSGPDQLDIDVNDLGNGGATPQLSDDQVDITVVPVNDPPTITAQPADTTVNEDSSVNLPGFNIADIDAGTSPVQITLTATDGTVALSNTTGITLVSSTGANLVVQGTIADINTALASLSFQPSADFNSSDSGRMGSVSLVVNDLGNTGNGGAQSSAPATVNITVDQANDPPSVTIPAGQQNQVVAEEGNVVITGTTIDDIDLIGADRADSNFALEVTLSTQNGGGDLSLAQTTGLTFTEGDGNSDGRIVFSGSLNDINAALASITYSGTSNFNGADSLQIAVNDQGNIGTGTTPVAMAQANITVTTVNDAPVITVPGAQNGAEESNLVINGISVVDADVIGAAAADPNVQFTVQLALDNDSGSLTLGDTTDITFAAGSANGQPNMTFTGNLNAINNALSSITYRGNADFNGADTIRVDVNDQGNAGAPGPLSAVQQTIALDIAQVNDPVDIDVPPGQQSITVNEDTGIDITGITLDDPDGNNTTVEVTLAVSDGTLTLAQTNGLTFVNGADGTGSMVLSGTITDINAAIATLTYQGTLDYSGPDQLQITVNDLGNGGTTPQVSNDQVDITVVPVNDPPTITAQPADTSATEDGSVTLPGFSVADIDAGNSPVQITLTATDGTVALSNTTGLTLVSSTGANLVVQGTIADINTALASLSFQPSTDFNSTDTGRAGTVSLVVNDLGNTGNGGAQDSAPATVNITVDQANDPPSVTIPVGQQNQTVAEEGDVIITGTTVGDIDVMGADRADSNVALEVTLSTQNGGGDLSLAQTTGLTFTEGDGTSDGRIVFSGSLNDINAALASITYSGTSNFNGTDSLQVAVNDQGNIGTGTTPVAMAQANITVTTTNDAPVITVPGAQNGTEETNLIINGTSIADADIVGAAAADPNVQFTVQLALDNDSGTLTLGDTTDITFAAGSANGQPGMTFTGNLNAINNALNSITYRGNADFNGTDTIRVDVNDQGNIGAPGPLEAVQQSIALNITQVNDPVDIDVPPGQQNVTVNEDTGIDITGITLDDPDGNNTTIEVTLAVSNGTLTLAQTNGLTFVNGADGTGSMTLSGTVTDINAAIATLTYQGTLNYSGPDQLEIDVNDLGNGGATPQLSDDQVDITVVPVNDPPTIAAQPADTTVNEDSSAALSGFVVADVDAGNNPVQITLAATDGSITLSNTNGLTLVSSNGANLVVQGTIADINTALGSLSFQPTADFNSTDAGRAGTVTLTVNDLGNTGNGGAQSSAPTTVNVTVNPVNDPPVLDPDGPGPVDPTDPNNPYTTTFTEDGPAVAVLDPAVSIVDTDASDSTLDQVTIQITNLPGTDGETLSVDPTALAGTNITASYNPANGTLTLSGTDSHANYQNVLAAVVYENSSDAPDTTARTLDIRADDGNGGVSSVTTIVNVVPANDAPTITSLPATPSTAEDTSVNLTGINIADPDAANDPVRVTLSATDGTLTLNNTNGLTLVNGSTNGSDLLVVEGTVTDINTALNDLQFTPDEHFNSTDNGRDARVEVTVDDLGNNGVGGAANSGTQGFDIEVTAVNDPLVVDPDGPGPVDPTTPFDPNDPNTFFANTFVENGPGVNVVDPAVTITDPDVGNNTLSGVAVVITNLPGTDGETLAIPAGALAGTNISANYDANTGTLSLTGADSLANYQAALAQISYENSSDVPNTTDRVVEIRATGGNGETATSTSVISITPVNDAPTVANIPANTSVNEDTTLTLPGFSVADVDASGQAVQVTLSATDGTLSLASLNGLTLISNNDPSSLTVQGTIADINTALTMLGFTGNNNFNSTETGRDATVTITVDDLGNSGTGGAQTAGPQTMTITVNPVNDTPVVDPDGPGPVDPEQPFDPNNPSTFYQADFVEDGGAVALVDPAAVTVTDVDSALLTGVDVVVTNPQDGNAETIGIDPATLAGTNITASYDPSTHTLSLLGNDTTANYQTVLASLNYDNSSQAPDTTNRVVEIRSNDGQGIGTATTVVTVQAVNDAPTLTGIPGNQNATEDTALLIPGLVISDVDAGNAPVEITLTATDGTLTLGDVTNVSFANGTANGQDTITVRGTVADLNNALATLNFTGDAHFNSDDTGRLANVTVVANDLGNSGTGGAQASPVGSFDINVAAVNDPPVIDPDGPGPVDPEQPFDPNDPNTFFAVDFLEDAGPVSLVDPNALTITDPDLNDNTLMGVDIVLTNNLEGAAEILAIDPATLAGTNITANYTPGTATLSLSGLDTHANYQAVLASITYDNSSQVPNLTDRVVEIRANDGSPSNNLGVTTTVISMEGVNDAPVITAQPADTTTDEDTAAALSGFTFTDIDDRGLPVQITLNSTDGQVNLSDVTGLTVISGSPAGDNQLVLQGTVTALNNSLASLGFTPTLNFNTTEAGRDATVSMVVNDLGNTGQGGALESSTQTVNITVNAVNDPPALTVPADQTVNEDMSIDLDGLGVSDPDIGTGIVTVTITANDGTFTFGDTTGITFEGGTVNGDGTITISGTLDDINNALDNVSYQGNPDFNGTDTITVTASDGDASVSDTFDITVTPVNDDPVLDPDGPGPIDPNVPFDPNDPNTFFANTFTEDAGAVAGVDTGLVLSDADGDMIQAATISITNLQDGAAEQLLIDTTGTNITAVYDPATGTLTLSGTDTAANYQAVLATLQYNNSSQDPTAGDRVIQLSVNDGTSDSNLGTSVITVIPVNDIPVLDVNESLVVRNGDTAVIDASVLSVIDADHPPADLTYTVLQTPGRGEILLDGVPLGVGDTFTQADINAGRLTFTDTTGSSGSATAIFQVDDPKGGRIDEVRLDIAVGNLIPDSSDPTDTNVVPDPLRQILDNGGRMLDPFDTQSGGIRSLFGASDLMASAIQNINGIDVDPQEKQLTNQEGVWTTRTLGLMSSEGSDAQMACSLFEVLDMGCRFNDTQDPNARLETAQAGQMGMAYVDTPYTGTGNPAATIGLADSPVTDGGSGSAGGSPCGNLNMPAESFANAFEQGDLGEEGVCEQVAEAEGAES